MRSRKLETPYVVSYVEKLFDNGLLRGAGEVRNYANERDYYQSQRYSHPRANTAPKPVALRGIPQGALAKFHALGLEQRHHGQRNPDHRQ
jgi:hypothetical protein